MDTPERPSWDPCPTQVSPFRDCPLTIECSEESGLEADVYEWDFEMGEIIRACHHSHMGCPEDIRWRYRFRMTRSSTINQYVTVDNLSSPELIFWWVVLKGHAIYSYIHQSERWIWSALSMGLRRWNNPKEWTHPHFFTWNYTVTLGIKFIGIGTQS